MNKHKQRTKMMNRNRCLSTFAVAIFSSTTVFGAINAYEGFDYTSGDALAGKDAPAPLGVWSGAASVNTNGLQYSGQQTSGLAARADAGGRAFIDLGSTVNTGVQYISFLASNLGEAGIYSSLEFRVGTSSDPDTRFLAGVSNDTGSTGGEFVAMNSPAYAFARTGIVRDNATHLFVLKIDYTPAGTGTDQLTFYFDPTPGQAEPATGLQLTGDFAFSHIGIAKFIGSSQPVYDEIRLGTTFASVTPVPEPAVASSLGLAALAFCSLRRRNVKNA